VSLDPIQPTDCLRDLVNKNWTLFW